MSFSQQLQNASIRNIPVSYEEQNNTVPVIKHNFQEFVFNRNATPFIPKFFPYVPQIEQYRSKQNNSKKQLLLNKPIDVLAPTQQKTKNILVNHEVRQLSSVNPQKNLLSNCKSTSADEVFATFDSQLKGRQYYKNISICALSYLNKKNNSCGFLKNLINKLSEKIFQQSVDKEHLSDKSFITLLKTIQSTETYVPARNEETALRIILFKTTLLGPPSLQFPSFEQTLEAIQLCKRDRSTILSIIEDCSLDILHEATYEQLNKIFSTLLNERIYKSDFVESLLWGACALIKLNNEQKNFSQEALDLCFYSLKVMSNFGHIHQDLFRSIEEFGLEICSYLPKLKGVIKLSGELLRCYAVIRTSVEESSKHAPLELEQPERIKSLFSSWPHQIDSSTINCLKLYQEAHSKGLITSFALDLNSKALDSGVSLTCPSRSQSIVWQQLQKSLPEYTFKTEHLICSCLSIDIAVLDKNNHLLMAIEIDGDHHFFTDTSGERRERKVSGKDKFRDKLLEAEGCKIYHIPISKCTHPEINEEIEYISEFLSK